MAARRGDRFTIVQPRANMAAISRQRSVDERRWNSAARWRTSSCRSGNLSGRSIPAFYHAAPLARAAAATIQQPFVRTLFDPLRSEEHTSELQSRQYLVCRLLL